MINRRLTRLVYNSTEKTPLVYQPNGSGFSQIIADTDALYVGYHGKFASRYFQLSVYNSVSNVLSVSYWNGSSWADVDDVVDQTSSGGKSFSQSGFVSWSNKSDWVLSSLSGVDSDVQLYWVKFTWSVTMSTVTIKSVLNIYADNQLLSAYYPELVSDANYLPSGKTDFLDQHLAAKDLCVLRMKQRKVIADESQIIDANEVAIAAVHACAWMILNPISTSDVIKQFADRAKADFEHEISQLTIHVDENKDGIISSAERESTFGETKVTRR